MSSLSSFLTMGALLLSSSSLISSATASSSYGLANSFEGSNFFDKFSFTTGSDPTHGFVQYMGQSDAESEGLIRVTPQGTAYIGVDNTTTLTSSSAGRKSVSIRSTESFTQGLLIADILHMPGSICGVWPAFWTVGPNWPSGGEIDIIEGVNLQDTNSMVLHTQGECTISGSGQSGTVSGADCSLTAGTEGCKVTGGAGTYGTNFNNQQGGVYAMQWTDEAIVIWFFPRNAIPSSITEGNPDPSTFGTPLANFAGSCNVGQQFQAQQIIFDTTFCGDWAGNVYSTGGCPMSQAGNGLGSCVDYVASNPGQYSEAYWEINSIKVYQQGAKNAGISSDPSVSSDPSISSAQSESIASTSTTAASTSQDPPSTVSAINTQATGGAGVDVHPSAVTAFTSATASAANAKQTVTTEIVTSYVDICPEGLTTSTLTQTVTYCPGDTTTGTIPFTTKTTVCTACGSTPSTVTLTVPHTPAQTSPVQTTAEEGTTTECPRTTVTATLTSVPAPASSAPASSAPAPSVPASSAPAPSVPAASVPSSAAPTTSVPEEPSSVVVVVPTPAASSPGGAPGTSSVAPVSSAAPVPSSPATFSSVGVSIPSATPSVVPSSSAAVVPPAGSSASSVEGSTPTVSTPGSPPLFTGGAQRVSVGMSGLAAALVMALLA